ncbi:MAG: flagellar hook-length control protein FliK [Selenomonadaceae bacterium]|nr:flagellar hook-length control protein FliK [Selenomonadaceae bacterium]
MSIMPQARDTKAQSMLDFLSGKTWQSADTEKDVPQNLNLQNLFAQSDQASTVQPVQIQPQYQPRVLDIQAAVQPTLQAQAVTSNQATLQMQIPTDLQPVTTANQASIQPQLQADLQPLTKNQAPVQMQIPTDVQPVLTTNQATLQVQPQNNFQPVMSNQAPVQMQMPTDVQPVATNQATLQVQPQTDFQPVMTNQAPVQMQMPTDVQPVLTTNQATLQVQPQNNFQPVMPNQAPVQVQPQNNFQPVITANQPTLQVQPQNNFQPVMSNQPLQVQPQENIQPLVTNQPTLQSQAQPQFQQQQFGAEIQPQINSLQPQLDSKTVNRQVVEDMLGVNLQVDDTRPATEPLMPLQNFSRQFNQNQQSAQNFQQNFAPMTAQVETKVAEQMPQGVENFAGNIAALNTTQSQPTAQVQAPEVMQAPREDFNVPTQIVEQARMIRTNTNTEMVIQLKPEHLGELTLRVSVSTNGAVTASFYSDNAQVRAIIENSIVHLRQELNEQGIKVDNVEVYAGLSEEGLLNGQGQQAWQQNQQQRNNRGAVDYDAAAEEEVVEAINPNADTLSADGVDYKV